MCLSRVLGCGRGLAVSDLNLDGIGWVIYGGESGPGYRQHDLEWPRAMRRKCQVASIPFFYKQSPSYRTEMGVELDGEIVQQYPRYEMKSPQTDAYELCFDAK